MAGTLAISIGDVTGIGPEVTLKALAEQEAREDLRFVLIGDEGWLNRLRDELCLELELSPSAGPPFRERISVLSQKELLPEELAPGAPAAAQAAVSWLRDGAKRCLRGEVDALVTGPVNKEAIVRSGQAFVGQTEFLSELAGADRTAMMLLGEDGRGLWLRVVLVTTHLAIRNVADHVTPDRVRLAIDLAIEAGMELGLSQPRIAVCGLNPHSGEGGEFGTEDEEIIVPVVQTYAGAAARVEGPLAADTVFYQAYHGGFDLVVAMYHDQGLAPLKMVAFERGVNWTLGLPFIRTSPDHGTGYDIVGQRKAKSTSMSAAIHLAHHLVQRRAASPGN